MSQKIKAAVFHAFGKPAEVVRIEERELPAVAAGHALVRVVAAPINPVDLNVIEGRYPIRPVLPATPGSEGAAIVERVGANVDSVREGDLVLTPRSFGSWCEAGVVNADELIAVPRGISQEQAAMMKVNPPTALRLLRDFVPVQPGDFVLQNAGNSAVGRAVIQIAHARRIRTISLVRRAALIDELKADGADFGFLDDEEAPPRIALAAGGAPIRLAINSVGGESALRLANSLAPGGTLVTIGAMSRQPLRIPNGLLIFKDLRFRGFWITPAVQRESRDERAAMYGELFALAQRGVLRTPVEKTYPLDQVAEAIAHAQRSERGGKILFKLSDE
jgi:NADPH:quinone reductase-like Zn-dependent oxidoreductase